MAILFLSFLVSWYPFVCSLYTFSFLHSKSHRQIFAIEPKALHIQSQNVWYDMTCLFKLKPSIEFLDFFFNSLRPSGVSPTFNLFQSCSVQHRRLTPVSPEQHRGTVTPTGLKCPETLSMDAGLRGQPAATLTVRPSDTICPGHLLQLRAYLRTMEGRTPVSASAAVQWSAPGVARGRTTFIRGLQRWVPGCESQ